MSFHDDQSAPQPPIQVASDGVEFDEENGTYRAQFDFHSRDLNWAIIEAVSVAAGSDPIDLPPLHSVVDPDALNRLFAPTVAGGSRGDGSVIFDYAGHRVTAHSYGLIEVHPPEEDG